MNNMSQLSKHIDSIRKGLTGKYISSFDSWDGESHSFIIAKVMPVSNDGTSIIVESATGEEMFLDLSFVYELIVNGEYTKHQEIDHCDTRLEYHVHDVTDEERKRIFDTAATTIMLGVVKTELYGGGYYVTTMNDLASYSIINKMVNAIGASDCLVSTMPTVNNRLNYQFIFNK